MFLHLSVLAGYFAPIVGWVLPIAIWQIKRNDLPELDIHGRIVANWLISTVLYFGICFVLCFVGIGFPLMFLLWLANIVFTVIGGLKASNGEVWHYPMAIQWV